MKTRLLIVSFLAIVIAHASFGQTKEKQHRIVFHLANSDTLVHKALVKQLGNVLDYWPTAQIEVVVHNNGIGFMKADEARFAKEITALKGRGVAFAVCENTLKLRKIEKAQILPTAIFVPVGLAEIVLKQEDGWSYIKAGF
jgi:intracellular sulfur oxidation DsrE/DsrF family protein